MNRVSFLRRALCILAWTGVFPISAHASETIDWAHHNGHTYYLLRPSTWAQAQTNAVRLGGHLVTVDDAAEDAFVFQRFGSAALADAGVGAVSLWIGLSDQVNEGTFAWSSGAASDYRNWGGGQPQGGISDEDYVGIFVNSGTPGTWHDIVSDGRLGDITYGVVEVPSVESPTVNPPLGIVSWWPGENTAWDVVGQAGGSMKNANLDGQGAYGSGKVGRAFAFDGVDDHVQATDAPGLDLTGNLTIEAWVRHDGAAGERAIVSKRDGDNLNVSYTFFLRDGVLHFASRSVGGPFVEVGGPVVPTSAWVHVAATLAQGEIRFYVNGLQEHLAPYSATRPDTAGPLTIGATVTDAMPTATPDGPFVGLIDELTLYNRALSTDELESIYWFGKNRHDPARDFSEVSNPNAPWSFGWLAVGSFSPSDLDDPNLVAGGLFPAPAYDGGSSMRSYAPTPEGLPVVQINTSPTARFTTTGAGGTEIDYSPRQIGFHPSPDGKSSLVRWTAKEAGRYAVSATFTGVDARPTSTNVYLFHDDTRIFPAPPPAVAEPNFVNSYRGDGISFTREVNVLEGETLSWMVNYAGDFSYDNTGAVLSVALLGYHAVDSSPITLNTAPETGNIAEAWEVDERTFLAPGGSRLTISVGGSGAPLPALEQVRVKLLDEAGVAVANTENAGPGETAVIHDVVVPDGGGAYRVQVRAPSGATGQYRIAVWDTSSARPLVTNQQHLGNIGSPNGVEHWTFPANIGRQIRLELVNSSDPDVVFTLRGPDGWTGFDEVTGASDEAIAPAAGVYTLTAYSTVGASNLNYTFRLVDAAPISLIANTPYTGQFESDGEAQLFRLEIPSGGPLELVLQNDGADNRAEIYASRDILPSRTSHEYAAASGPGASRSLSIPHASAGVWYVLVYVDKVPVPGDYTLEASLSGISLTGIATSSQSGNVPAHLTILGAGFRAGMVVELVSGSGDVYAATTVAVDAYDRLTASFSANVAPPGVYSVRATLPEGGGIATLPGAFTYLPAGEARLETQLIMPAALGRHAVATIYVEYANTGTAPMPAPVLIVESADADGSDRPILTLDSNRVIHNFWSGTEGLPPGTSNEVFILASGAQPGMLNPGERFQVPVHYIGLLQPWDMADSAVELEIRYWTEDDTNPLEWTARKEALRPPTLDAAIWDVVYANLTSGLTSTADYVAMLNDNARYLGRLGLRVTDVGDLWHFEVQQAYGHTVLPILDSVSDVAVVAPGLPLQLTRTFSSNLRSRNAVGFFGQGWFTPWQTRLLAESGGSVVKLVGEAGAASVYSRDTRGNRYFSDAGDTTQLTAVGGDAYELRQPNGSFTRYRVDGFVDYTQDANGNRVTATWSAGRLTALAHSSGDSLAISYGGNGRISQILASTGHSVTYTYSGDYLVSATTDDSKTTSYTYDTVSSSASVHALTSVTRRGVSRHFAWDSRGRLASTHLADGQDAIAFDYGSAGSVAVTQAAATTTLFFEHRGLLAKSLNPLGYVTTSEFDADLRLKRLVLPSGENRHYTWSSSGSPATIIDELGRTTRFRYDHPMKRLTSFSDAKGNGTQYSYDAKGNLLETTYADGSVESLGNYTAHGLPQTWTNRRGQAIASTWTTSGQLDRQTFADGSYHDFDYDARGNLVQVVEHPATGPDKITSYTFDAATSGDRLKRVDYPDGRWVEYAYDTHGRRSRLTDSAGGETLYQFDTAGRLQRLRDATDTELAEYHYDAAGRLNRIDKGNGSWTAYTYDAAGRILTLTNHAPDGTPESEFAHSYDARGRRIGATTQDGVWSYTYDATGQLLRAVFASTNPAIDSQDLSYEYDAAGNRTFTKINGVETGYVPNELNQYTSVGGATRSYDEDGNLLSDGERTYQYNAQNQLVQVDGPEGTTQYEYNALGNRAATVLNGVRTEYLLDPTGSVDVVADFRGGNPVARNVHGLGLAARHLDGGDSLYFDIDPIGSVIATRGQDGAVLTTQTYLPFGETLATSGATVDNPYRFVGFFGVTSEANGLGFMRARFYAPGIGKFANDDPIGLGGGDLNLTRYVANNPVTFIDSQGTDGVEWLGNVGKQTDGKEDAWARVGDPTWEGTDRLNEIGEQVGNTESAGESIKGIAEAISPGGKKPGPGLGRLGKAVFKLAKEAWDRRGKKKGSDDTGDLPSSPGDSSSPRTDSPPTPGGGNGGARGGSGSAGSIDPNEKIGPGFGPEGWVTADSLLPYRINFENIGPGSKDENGDPYPIQATAPAQRVTITDDLEDDLDWDSFRITDFGWGDTHINVPPDTSHHTETVVMTYGDKTFEVEVEAGIDYSTGRIFVVFQSLEAGTGLPPDVLTGFLPPEDGDGVGKGHFSYTIRTKASLATGTEIRNVAVIKFDGNETIATNQINPQDASEGTSPDKEALVTLDGDVPSATVTALPASTTSPDFTVSWGGSDSGSGIVDYDLYVSEDGGPWELWLAGTPETSALYAGEIGRQYGFLAVARDRAGNTQALGNSAQATTTVVLQPEIDINLSGGSALTSGSGVTFGKVTVGASRSLTFRVRNLGNANLTGLKITRGGTNAANFVVKTQPVASVAAGGSTQFVITFTPSAGGSRSCALHLASNDADENPFNINLTGSGLALRAPEIVVEQPVRTRLVDGKAKVSFANTTIGEKSVKTFTVRNIGKARLSGLAVRLGGANDSEFAVGALEATSLAPGASTTFKVTFKPKISGLRTATIRIASNDADEKPFNIALSGTGVKPKVPKIVVQQGTGATKILKNNMSKRDFGAVKAGNTSKGMVFTIKNKGTAKLTMVRVTFKGKQAKDFIILTKPAKSVAPGKSTRFTVAYKPGTVESSISTLEIASNDKTKNPFRVKVSGNIAD